MLLSRYQRFCARDCTTAIILGLQSRGIQTFSRAAGETVTSNLQLVTATRILPTIFPFWYVSLYDLGSRTIQQQWYFKRYYHLLCQFPQAGRFWERGGKGGKAFLYLQQLGVPETHVMEHKSTHSPGLPCVSVNSFPELYCNFTNFPFLIELLNKVWVCMLVCAMVPCRTSFAPNKGFSF